ncbi:hypothetical protein BJV82DRAFT_669247 [Fennellomyces sp. T-0311]|nr:hypothetical protein BJV82DRAFT_669247 [Fennellomyces sp. T-0311]
MQDIFCETYDVMEGQVDIEDQYQIIVDEFNEGTGGIQSLVSMTARENVPQEQRPAIFVQAPKARGRPPKKHEPKDDVPKNKDIVHLINTIQEFALSAAAAAPIALMSVRSAQRYWKYYRDGEPYLPSLQKSNSKQRDPTLLQQHTHHLEQLYDKDPTTTLAQAQELLLRVYNVKITQSGLQKHLVKHCGLTMKKIEPVSEARNSPQTIKAQFNWALD